jgi:uncharacterized membrane protein YcaP (DUF421 family)
MEPFDNILGRALLVILTVILMTRIQGLRSFSKMSGFDFSITVAFGSIIGGFAISPDADPMIGVFAVVTIFLIQGLLAFFRQRLGFVPRLIDNEPLLLMRDGEILTNALRRAQMTEADLMAKLREANVLSFAQVRAVVMESTGDVSVLHQDGAKPDIEKMIEGVRKV